MDRIRRRNLFTLCAVALVLALAVLISPWAARAPDGLEKIAQELGLADHQSAPPAWAGSPASDYQVPGVTSKRTATRLAGLLGIAVAFVGGVVLGRVLMKRRTVARDMSRLKPRRATGDAAQPDPQS